MDTSPFSKAQYDESIMPLLRGESMIRPRNNKITTRFAKSRDDNDSTQNSQSYLAYKKQLRRIGFSCGF